jgi:hypothetical protein
MVDDMSGGAVEALAKHKQITRDVEKNPDALASEYVLRHSLFTLFRTALEYTQSIFKPLAKCFRGHCPASGNLFHSGRLRDN